ncbi:MAG: hypothetical protein KRP56_06405 [Candidatus Methanogranum gryphiswaldense]|nr:MAG: hypothetical protein KRP56_06405 [Candidatus Methanogranum sp. U3.2.1]
MTLLEIVTICISLISAAIIPIIIVAYTSNSNKKLQNERIIFEKELLIKQDEKDKEIVKMQTQLENINKKLELEQQFIIEKKKYIFESKINAIDEMLEDLFALQIDLIYFTQQDNEFNVKIEKIEECNIHACNAVRSSERAMINLDQNMSYKYLEIFGVIKIITENYAIGKKIGNKEIFDISKRINEFTKQVNIEKEKLCNEGLEIKK